MQEIQQHHTVCLFTALIQSATVLKYLSHVREVFSRTLPAPSSSQNTVNYIKQKLSSVFSN